MKSIISILQEKKDLIDHWIQQRKKIKKSQHYSCCYAFEWLIQLIYCRISRRIGFNAGPSQKCQNMRTDKNVNPGISLSFTENEALISSSSSPSSSSLLENWQTDVGALLKPILAGSIFFSVDGWSLTGRFTTPWWKPCVDCIKNATTSVAKYTLKGRFIY